MFIMTKQAVLIYSPDRSQKFRAPKDYMGDAPEWVKKTKQFQRMVAEGTMVVSETKKKTKKDAEKPESADGSPADDVPNTGETEK